MTKYIPINAVLNYIPQGIREEDDEINLLMWVMQGLRITQISQRFERIVCLFDLKDHKLVLPDDVQEINCVSYMNKAPDEKCQAECNSCIVDPCVTAKFPYDPTAVLGEGIATSKCRCNICQEEDCCTHIQVNHRLFLESNFHSKNFMPLRYVGNQSKLCNNCVDSFSSNECKETYTVDIDLILTSSMQDGMLCIDYFREPKRDGDYLIPDDEDLKRGLATYAEAMHWRNRRARKEQSTHNFYKDTIVEAETLLRKAKGKFKLRNLDVEFIKNLTFGRNKLLKHNLVVNWTDNWEH
jgi:hypothetical protein